MSEKHSGMTVVRVKFDILAFMGSDMRKYGPFKVGDVATIPKANAEFLMGKGIVSLVEETSKKEEENNFAPADYNLKAKYCDQTAEVAKDDSGGLKRQLQELTAQVDNIAARIDRFESMDRSVCNKKRLADKNRSIAYLNKEDMQAIEPWRMSPDEKATYVLRRCLRWLSENLKANQNHQNTLQKGSDS